VHNSPTCRRNVQQNSGKTGILDQHGNATIFGLKIRFRARDISHGYAILSPEILARQFDLTRQFDHGISLDSNRHHGRTSNGGSGYKTESCLYTEGQPRCRGRLPGVYWSKSLGIRANLHQLQGL
jgi:hypothetical protein